MFVSLGVVPVQQQRLNAEGTEKTTPCINEQSLHITFEDDGFLCGNIICYCDYVITVLKEATIIQLNSAKLSIYNDKPLLILVNLVSKY